MESNSATRARRPARLCRPWMVIGSAMLSPTVIRGSSDPNGSWKMIWAPRRNLRKAGPSRSRIASPPMRTLPPLGSISRSSKRPAVDFPQPLSPTRPSVSPSPISKEMPSTARTCAVAPPNQASRVLAAKTLRRSRASTRGPLMVQRPARPLDGKRPAGAPTPAAGADRCGGIRRLQPGSADGNGNRPACSQEAAQFR